MRQNSSNTFEGGMQRFIGAVFGLAFFGIGLTALGFLWLTPFDQFGSPPLFFRIFGSFIGIVFTCVGGAVAFGSLSGKLGQPSPERLMARLAAMQAAMPQPSTPTTPATAPPPGSYVCPRCAAPLQSNVDVSPLGDVKCPFCKSWFNIKQKQA